MEYLFFWQRRRVCAGTVYISCLFACKPKKRIGIQNGYYNRFAETLVLCTLETSYVFILYVYYSGIKLDFASVDPLLAAIVTERVDFSTHGKLLLNEVVYVYKICRFLFIFLISPIHS